MNIAKVKSERRINVRDVTSLKIQAYDAGNDYPQKIEELIAESGTASLCTDIYSKFISGKGFSSDIAVNIVNRKGSDLNDILTLCAEDLAMFHGFAIHVNYNDLYEICEISHVPFKTCRLGVEDETGYIPFVAVNRDWTGIKKRADVSNTQYINVYNPIKEVVRAQVQEAGSIDAFRGQILWVSYSGAMTYPLSIIDPVITDVSSEGATSTVKNRNVKNNFLPAGLAIFNKSQAGNPDLNEQLDNEEVDAFSAELAKLQGDENACKIMAVGIDQGETPPSFVPFHTENYDKTFTYTEESVQRNIGRRYAQPPVLRAEDTSDGFADDKMQQAFNFYNNHTDRERSLMERSFKKILGAHTNILDLDSIHIQPLSYVSNTAVERSDIQG